MLILAKSALALMIGFIISVVVGLIILPILKKFNLRQKTSIFAPLRHQNKSGTPTFGGLIFIIPTIATIFILSLLGKINISSELLIVLFVFFGYSIIGFLDDYIKIKKNRNDGLTTIQKLIGQIIIAIIFYIIYHMNGGDSVLWIYTLGIKIDLGWLYSVFILLMLVGFSNAVNLTDGLDGLAGGLSTISFLAMGIIAWGSSWVSGSPDLAVFCFILTGSLLGFLVFNGHPAKVFMGDTGSLALGGTLATVAIITNHEFTLFIIAGVFIIEVLTSVLQIISVMWFKKKIFLMTPLHHHFEKLGWSEVDIVRSFFVAGLILAMVAVTFAVWI